jgi:hypothetical protein
MSRSRSRPRPFYRPSYRDKKPLPLVELAPDPRGETLLVGTMFGVTNAYFREYLLGECPVVVTREGGRWHLSISHPRRYPTWDEIAEARYRLLPKTQTFALPLPPAAEYINLHKNCFHVYEIAADAY